jgi:transcriptional regulator with XRE-family HTH domain
MPKAKRDEVPGLAEKLKAAREAAGLSQVAAEAASGVHRVTISVFESGGRTPTLATLLKLAEAYGVDVAELIPRPQKGAAAPVPEAAPAPPPAPKTGRKK